MVKRIGFVGIGAMGAHGAHKIELINNFAAIDRMAQARISGVSFPPQA